MFDIDFRGHAIKVEFVHYHCWIPWSWKHTYEKYFQKFGRGGKIPGVGTHPPPWTSERGFLPWASEGFKGLRVQNIFSDSGSYRNQGSVNATILAFFMTSCQPFSCVPTCADQYIIVNKHARSAIGQNCWYRTVHIVLSLNSMWWAYPALSCLLSGGGI